MEMTTSIFKANVSTPYGLFLVAVDSTEYNAKSDIIAAVQSDLPSHIGHIRVDKVKKSNRRIISGMDKLSKCHNYQVGQWAWIRKI